MKKYCLVFLLVLLTGCTQRMIAADVAFIVPESMVDQAQNIDDIPLDACDAYKLGKKAPSLREERKSVITSYVLICKEDND